MRFQRLGSAVFHVRIHWRLAKAKLPLSECFHLIFNRQETGGIGARVRNQLNLFVEIFQRWRGDFGFEVGVGVPPCTRSAISPLSTDSSAMKELHTAIAKIRKIGAEKAHSEFAQFGAGMGSG